MSSTVRAKSEQTPSLFPALHQPSSEPEASEAPKPMRVTRMFVHVTDVMVICDIGQTNAYRMLGDIAEKYGSTRGARGKSVYVTLAQFCDYLKLDQGEVLARLPKHPIPATSLMSKQQA